MAAWKANIVDGGRFLRGHLKLANVFLWGGITLGLAGFSSPLQAQLDSQGRIETGITAHPTRLTGADKEKFERVLQLLLSLQSEEDRRFLQNKELRVEVVSAANPMAAGKEITGEGPPVLPTNPPQSITIWSGDIKEPALIIIRSDAFSYKNDAWLISRLSHELQAMLVLLKDEFMDGTHNDVEVAIAQRSNKILGTIKAQQPALVADLDKEIRGNLRSIEDWKKRAPERFRTKMKDSVEEGQGGNSKLYWIGLVGIGVVGYLLLGRKKAVPKVKSDTSKPQTSRDKTKKKKGENNPGAAGFLTWFGFTNLYWIGIVEAVLLNLALIGYVTLNWSQASPVALLLQGLGYLFLAVYAAHLLTGVARNGAKPLYFRPWLALKATLVAQTSFIPLLGPWIHARINASSPLVLPDPSDQVAIKKLMIERMLLITRWGSGQTAQAREIVKPIEGILVFCSDLLRVAQEAALQWLALPNKNKPFIFLVGGVGPDSRTIREHIEENDLGDERLTKLAMGYLNRQLDELARHQKEFAGDAFWHMMKTRFGIERGEDAKRDVEARTAEDHFQKKITPWSDFYPEFTPEIAASITIEEWVFNRLLNAEFREITKVPNALVFCAVMMAMGVEELQLKVYAHLNTTSEVVHFLNQVMQDSVQLTLGFFHKPALNRRTRSDLQSLGGNANIVPLQPDMPMVRNFLNMSQPEFFDNALSLLGEIHQAEPVGSIIGQENPIDPKTKRAETELRRLILLNPHRGSPLSRELYAEQVLIEAAGNLQQNLSRGFDPKESSRLILRKLYETQRQNFGDDQKAAGNASYLAGRAGLPFPVEVGHSMQWLRGRIDQWLLNLLALMDPVVRVLRRVAHPRTKDVTMLHLDDVLRAESVGDKSIQPSLERAWETAKAGAPAVLFVRSLPGETTAAENLKKRLIEYKPAMARFLAGPAVIVTLPMGPVRPSDVLREAMKDSKWAQSENLRLSIYTSQADAFDLDDPAVAFVLYVMLSGLKTVAVSVQLKGARLFLTNA